MSIKAMAPANQDVSSSNNIRVITICSDGDFLPANIDDMTIKQLKEQSGILVSELRAAESLQASTFDGVKSRRTTSAKRKDVKTIVQEPPHSTIEPKAQQPVSSLIITLPEHASRAEAEQQKGIQIAVVGQVFSGKSSLINSLRGLEPSDSGSISTRMDKLQDNVRMSYELDNVTLWEIPFHTLDSNIDFDRYDAVVICSSERLSESDVRLAGAAQKSGLPCFVLRTKIDRDIEANIEDYGPQHNEDEHLRKIKQDIERQLPKGMHVEVFQVSCKHHHLRKWDMPKVKNMLLNVVPKKTNAISREHSYDAITGHSQLIPTEDKKQVPNEHTKQVPEKHTKPEILQPQPLLENTKIRPKSAYMRQASKDRRRAWSIGPPDFKPDEIIKSANNLDKNCRKKYIIECVEEYASQIAPDRKKIWVSQVKAIYRKKQIKDSDIKNVLLQFLEETKTC